MKTIEFSDNPDFYRQLKKALASKEQIQVITPYTTYGELPQKLKDIFELEKHRSGKWIDLASGKFILGATAAPVGINYRHVYVFASAAVGGLAGVVIGGPVAGAIGASLGALIGMAAGAMESGKHKVEVEITRDGKLRFNVTPA